jgi:hypothetical protein
VTFSVLVIDRCWRRRTGQSQGPYLRSPQPGAPGTPAPYKVVKDDLPGFGIYRDDANGVGRGDVNPRRATPSEAVRSVIP